jgi:hypothetical protein
MINRSLNEVSSLYFFISCRVVESSASAQQTDPGTDAIKRKMSRNAKASLKERDVTGEPPQIEERRLNSELGHVPLNASDLLKPNLAQVYA